MPYVDLSSYKDDFAKAHIVDSNIFSLLKEDSIQLKKYYSKKNDDIQSNLLRYSIAREYHVMIKEF